jgi:16S rRNA G1207 methylase RsmC
MTKWLKSHLPFHWFVQFYGIISRGGFDVIIGNPPYLEVREVDYELKNYASLDSSAIHAMCMERSANLLQKNGSMSMIVPLSLPSTQRMQVVQNILESNRNAWYANYAWRPAKLFDTVNRATRSPPIIKNGPAMTVMGYLNG